jgi:predicted naringenin-chalcone synthase
MKPTLIALTNAFPSITVSQEEIRATFFESYFKGIPDLAELFRATRVRQRHYVWDPRVEFDGRVPSLEERMESWEKAVLDVGGASVAEALTGIDLSTIGSFVMASCTGYAGPTPDLLLARRFELSRHLRRTFIGHMGCYAAFNVIKVAMDCLAARPNESVLGNCSEFCSLHLRKETTVEQAVIHALFGDASASFVLANREEGAGPQFLRTHTTQIYEAHEHMTWKVKPDGFRMTLSPYVPFLLSEGLKDFLSGLLEPEGLTRKDIKHWGIHPGGPKIVDLLGERLELSAAQLRPSFHVLGEHGNCSSSTVLLVMKEILEVDRPAPGEYGVFMAFGPGLTMEGLLVRF